MSCRSYNFSCYDADTGAVTPHDTPSTTKSNLHGFPAPLYIVPGHPAALAPNPTLSPAALTPSAPSPVTPLARLSASRAACLDPTPRQCIQSLFSTGEAGPACIDLRTAAGDVCYDVMACGDV